MESIRQEKYPQPSKKAIKNRLLWVCENRKTIKLSAKIIEKRKQIKKKTRHIVI